MNSKYIKIKRNWKLKAKFFRLFKVLQLVQKQSYKLELPKNWKIYNVFQVSLLKQNTRWKKRLDESQLKLDEDNGEEYEVEAICKNKVDTKKSDKGYLLGLHHLPSTKGYPEDENTWEPALAV